MIISESLAREVFLLKNCLEVERYILQKVSEDCHSARLIMHQCYVFDLDVYKMLMDETPRFWHNTDNLIDMNKTECEEEITRIRHLASSRLILFFNLEQA